MRHDIDGLEARLHSLGHALTDLADGESIAEVLRHIHQPGWTTPAEFFLVNELVSAMHAQVEVMRGLTGALVTGAREIGAAGKVAAEA
jgi:hypothetical protein